MYSVISKIQYFVGPISNSLTIIGIVFCLMELYKAVVLSAWYSSIWMTLSIWLCCTAPTCKVCYIAAIVYDNSTIRYI